MILARDGAVGGVDVRGAAPGTRETDLLAPGNLVTHVHGVMLAGGSAWGLAAADGAMRWLEEQGIGLDVRFGTLPIVPAAVLFDLPVGDARIRPDAAAGQAACEAASSSPPAEGNVGAGSGALVGKLFGVDRAMKGGIGSASITVGGVTVGALIACNALGDVLDRCRAVLGLNQSRLAALLGISAPMLSQVMSAQRIKIGNPNAVRAVGSACATNPLPVVVPCHRVLRTDGTLGGFRWGLPAKRWLIAHEAAH